MMKSFAAIAAFSTFAAANVEPFTETFETNAGWTDNGFGALTEVASGGPDGSSYVTTSQSFVNVDPDDMGGSFQVLFRGEPSVLPGLVPDASDGAFIGDYTASDIRQISFDIRTNAVAPVNVFVRFANANRFPGAVAVEFVPLFAGQWTTITLDITETSPNFVSFEGASYDDVFSNVGPVQIGVDATPLGGIPSEFTFDLDNVSLDVPAPSVAGALAMGGLVAARRRRG